MVKSSPRTRKRKPLNLLAESRVTKKPGEKSSDGFSFASEVEGRFGVLPNFFCSAPTAPGLIEELWAFAKAAYLDSPLPSMFKERLFVYLSRFCEIRYCIVRHVGFLIGKGRPAGDAMVQPETINQVVALLNRPLPDADALAQALSRLESTKGTGRFPVSETEEESDLFDGLTVIFLEPRRSERARNAVRNAVGEANLELLIAYLAFIRTAHYWTETHPDLAFEPDMVSVMQGHPELARLLLDPSDAERAKAGDALRRTLSELDNVKGSLQASEERQAFLLKLSDAEAMERTRVEAALRSSENRFQTVFKRIASGVVEADQSGRMTLVNERWCEMLGYSEAELLDMNIADITHPDSLQATLEAVQRLAEGGSDFEIEKLYRRKDGSSFWALSSVSGLRGAAGEYQGLVAIVLDISDRKRSEEHRKLLIDELNHRVKNTLAVVQSLANQTLRNAVSVEEAESVFSSRLVGLAKAHDVLTREQWAGADLREVVLAAIDAYTGQFQAPRSILTGPKLRMQPKSVLALSMALHELATNAVKHGALSNDTGTVTIEWDIVQDDRFQLRWTESGGPPVEHPRRRGFGSRLIEQGLAQDLGGEVRLDFARSGLICTIDAPLAEVTARLGNKIVYPQGTQFGPFFSD